MPNPYEGTIKIKAKTNQEDTGGYIMTNETAKTITQYIKEDIANPNGVWATKFNYGKQERKPTMPVFEVVVIEEPSNTDRDNGELERLVFGPVVVIAKDKESAGAVAVMENSDKTIGIAKTRMKILCRPFA